MYELSIAIDPPNDGQLADDRRVLDLWRQAHDLLSERNSVFVVGEDGESWFSVSVDAMQVITALESDIEAREDPSRESQELQAALHLRIERAGVMDSDVEFPADRLVEQLFLACNLALPGSCSFTRDPLVRLDPAAFESAFHLGRIPTDDSYEGDFWPELQPVSFQEAWEWLQEDLSYDIQVAATPAQKAVFTLLLVATRYPEDLDNLLALARCIEGIFGRGVRDNISRTIESRIEAAFGRPSAFPRWFMEFYDLRSRLIHGDKKLLRPGLRRPTSPDAFAVQLEHDGPQAHAVRLLLATVYRMIRLGVRDFV